MFNWFSFCTYSIITAFTPGPNNIMAMSNASRKGFIKALPLNLGMSLGFLLVMLMCTAFCSILSSLIPKIKLPMLIIGAIYMLYLAWKTFRSSGNIEDDNSHNGFLAGMMLQFVNPKIYIYCIMSMEAYILPFYQGKILSLIFFAVLLALFGTFGSFCWAAFGSVFKKLFSKHSKIVNTIMALLLVYCAVSLFLA